MHELSIALGILDAVADEAERRSIAVVKAVHIRFGPLSGVVGQSLTAAFELAREGTDLAGCELIMEETPLTVHCAVCDRDDVNDTIQNLCCPRCGSNDVSVVGGRELEVTALEIEA
jgi:hydrogenase nickel incorporation protein HypA/HybF